MVSEENQSRRYAVVVPACNEAACLRTVLDELRLQLPDKEFVLAVGVNGSMDNTAEIARSCAGVVVGETQQRGYGYGCMAAIDALSQAGEKVDGYVFFAADGANLVEDLRKVVQVREDSGADMVIGLRKFDLRTWWREFGRALPNLVLGLAAWPLSGKFFHDLGPLRVIDRELFERMALRELTWGWTIEAQVRASQLKAHVATVEVTERERIAGEQKVSGVSPWRSTRIGLSILAAGLRTYFRK
jgi:glycosyltransferase involved in cell wall biosynthesis